VLPASTEAQFGLTIHNAASDPYGLGIGLAWWIPGVFLAVGYAVYTYRHFAGKVRSASEMIQ
jgi:cytochrome d ubiquinol oxidase subunit II